MGQGKLRVGTRAWVAAHPEARHINMRLHVRLVRRVREGLLADALHGDRQRAAPPARRALHRAIAWVGFGLGLGLGLGFGLGALPLTLTLGSGSAHYP